MPTTIDGFAREDLNYYLKHLSKLAKFRKITGWDVRNGAPDESSNRDVHYMHSDISPENPHYTEVVDAIKEVTNPSITAAINVSIAERIAYFKQRNEWAEPERQNFYNFDGNELTFQNGKLYCKNGNIHTGPFLAEQKQLDMRIPAGKDEIIALIEMFNERACKYALLNDGTYRKDAEGQIIPNTRSDRFRFGSWEVPLVISPEPHVCMTAVHKYSLLPKERPIGSYATFLFHGNKDEMNKSIGELTELNKIEDVSLYANRVFVEDYLKTELAN